MGGFFFAAGWRRARIVSKTRKDRKARKLDTLALKLKQISERGFTTTKKHCSAARTFFGALFLAFVVFFAAGFAFVAASFVLGWAFFLGGMVDGSVW